MPWQTDSGCTSTCAGIGGWIITALAPLSLLVQGSWAGGLCTYKGQAGKEDQVIFGNKTTLLQRDLLGSTQLWFEGGKIRQGGHTTQIRGSMRQEGGNLLGQNHACMSMVDTNIRTINKGISGAVYISRIQTCIGGGEG